MSRPVKFPICVTLSDKVRIPKSEKNSLVSTLTVYGKSAIWVFTRLPDMVSEAV